MSIHQLTTLAGTASKPYLLRGNQQVTDQIHYGAAPAAGGSRAGGGAGWPRAGRGGRDRLFWGENEPLRLLGLAQPAPGTGTTSRRCQTFFFFFRPGKATGMLGELRAGSRCGWVPVGTLSLVGARGRPPPQEKKRDFTHSKLSVLERRASLPKPFLHPTPPHSGKKLSPH